MAQSKSKIVEQAVVAAQLYNGSEGMRMKDQQKLYRRMTTAIRKVATHYGIDESVAFDQITNEASKRGPMLPMPARNV